jgi:hypothetical protein
MRRLRFAICKLLLNYGSRSGLLIRNVLNGFVPFSEKPPWLIENKTCFFNCLPPSSSLCTSVARDHARDVSIPRKPLPGLETPANIQRK